MTTNAPPQDLMASGPLLSRQEAADMLNVSKATIYRLVRSGQIPAFRVGAQIRLAQVDLENYVRQLPPPLPEEEN